VLHRGVAKDRSAPFSRKHRRYWLPVTGGMLLIGAINLTLGYCSWPSTSMDRVPERIILQLPVSPYATPAASADAGPTSRDAGPDASGR
jgi:hypothetical protein